MDILFAHKKPYESMLHARPHLASSVKGEKRRPPKETSASYPLSPLLLPKCQKTISAPLVIEMPGPWKTRTCHLSPLVPLIKPR